MIRLVNNGAITLALLTVGVFGSHPGSKFMGYFAGAALFYWAFCISGLGARLFRKLYNPEDDREFNPLSIERRLDWLAQLIQEGRYVEAAAVCQQVEAERDANPLMIETAFLHLYQQMLDSMEKSFTLSDIRNLCASKKFGEAESKLQQLRQQQPENWAATLLLARIYAQYLGHPLRALALIEPANKATPSLPPQFVDLARQSIDEWSEKSASAGQTARSG